MLLAWPGPGRRWRVTVITVPRTASVTSHVFNLKLPSYYQVLKPRRTASATPGHWQCERPESDWTPGPPPTAGPGVTGSEPISRAGPPGLQGVSRQSRLPRNPAGPGHAVFQARRACGVAAAWHCGSGNAA